MRNLIVNCFEAKSSGDESVRWTGRRFGYGRTAGGMNGNKEGERDEETRDGSIVADTRRSHPAREDGWMDVNAIV